jgi:hypothetical protein
MKTLRTMVGLAAALAATIGTGAGIAAAGPYTETQLFGVCLSANSPLACNGTVGASQPDLEYDHYLPSYVTEPGYSFTFAQLTLGLADDQGSGDGSEKLNVFVNGHEVVSQADANHDLVIPLTDPSWFSEGELEVTITADRGDFVIVSARLDFDGELEPPGQVPPGQVPGPAPLALLGLGASMLGVMVLRRKS